MDQINQSGGGVADGLRESKGAMEELLSAAQEYANTYEKEKKWYESRGKLSTEELKNIQEKYPHQISSGEAQRVALARSLLSRPDLLLLDEPFAGVDPIAVEDIQAIVHSLKEREIGVLITDHNVRETLSITDRSYLLFDGKILKSGTSEFLANDDEAKRLYLGERFTL